MKTKFTILLYSCLLFIISCKNEITENKITETPSLLPELSIYNLQGEWLNQDSSSIKLENYRGDVIVMALIYVSCKAACPKIIADMLTIEKNISQQDLPNVKFVLVSIDPENDTPVVLKHAASEFQFDLNRWTLLSGSEADTRDIAAVLSFKYKRTNLSDFAHSNIISVLDQNGIVVYQQVGIETDNAQTLLVIHDLIANKNK